MKGIGLMGSMMVMGSKLGREGVGIEGSIDKGFDMVLVCIDFILGMCMLVNGLMVKLMVVGFILVKMEVDMLVNSSGVSNTALVTTILGMGTHMLESTSQIKCMDLECINLAMDIDMKELGMKEKDKGMECTHSEMEKPKLATGITEYLMSSVLRIPAYLPLLLIILKYSMLSRKLEEEQRKHMM